MTIIPAIIAGYYSATTDNRGWRKSRQEYHIPAYGLTGIYFAVYFILALIHSS
jgi:hypothetical protein